MKIPRWTLGGLLAVALAFALPQIAVAQGVTTGAISGTVTNEQGQPVEGAQVQVANKSTGTITAINTRGDGRYFAQGLDVGGPYTVSVKRIGFAPVERGGFFVNLGQTTRADVVLRAQATQLAAVTVTASSEGSVISQSHTGVGTTVSDSSVARLPSLNRTFTDFSTLAPQVSTTGAGPSGGGVNNRFNNIQLDGANEADLFGLSSTPTIGGLSNAKTVSLDAVKQFQVLLAPYDVRQGNFVGLLVNAVTKSGSNEFHGSAFGYTRDQWLTRTQPFLNQFNQQQYGFSLGGPIIKNRAFFFIAPEWQAQTQPSSGPYLGSSDAPIDATGLNAYTTALSAYGLPGGSAGLIQRKNPLTNVFARLDFNITDNTRLVVRENYDDASQAVFGGGGSRDPSTAAAPTFALASNEYTITNLKHSAVGQLFTNWSNGAYNEAIFGYTSINDVRIVPQHTPMITVTVPRGNGQIGSVKLVSGTENSSGANALGQTIMEITDNFTVPVGAHEITIGTKNQFYKPVNVFGQNVFGNWTFSSLDSLNKGIPATYLVSVPAAGTDGVARFRTATYGAYIQDQWQLTNRMVLTYGLRLDDPTFTDKPPFNQQVQDSFARRTDQVPSGHIQYSPRFGANWDVTGDQRNQVRFGAGLFTGPPAYVWMSNAFGNSGLSGYASLSCSNPSQSSPTAPPLFTPANAATPPTKCGGTNANPATAANGAAINLINPNFRFPQDLKASAGYDRDLGDGWFGTLEGMYSRAIYTPFYMNLALAGPTGALDRNGRTMYGTLTATSSSPTFVHPSRTAVYDVTNSSGDHSYNLTAGISKRFANRFEGSLYYTYSQAYDVQSTLNSTASSNFNQGRDVSGDINLKNLDHSKWEQPHRIVASGTYSFPSHTDVSLIYTGVSGARYDYEYNSDMNADGRAGNDLVYIPKDVRNQAEILFTGYNDPNKAASVASQQNAMDGFINSLACLRNQRGTIIRRDSCAEPWWNLVNLSVRQALPTRYGERFQVQFDAFNFGNLLNKNWGEHKTAVSTGLPGVFWLSRSGTLANGTVPQGVFTFDTNQQPFNFNNVESNYRLQLSVRYSY